MFGPSQRSTKLYNMKVTVIPVVVGAHGMVSKGLGKRLEEEKIRRKITTIQTTTVFKID